MSAIPGVSEIWLRFCVSRLNCVMWRIIAVSAADMINMHRAKSGGQGGTRAAHRPPGSGSEQPGGGTPPSVRGHLITRRVRFMLTQPGDALCASAGPARTQARPATPAGGLQPGHPGGIGQQLGNAVIARDGDDWPDPAARQRKPLPRPACC